MTDKDPTSPLKAAIIGSEDIEASLRVYRDVMALEVLERRRWEGPEFEALFRLPKGSSADTAVLADRGFRYGRIMLLQFDAKDRVKVRAPEDGSAVVGLLNLNFYARDIVAATHALEAAGCRPWSEPRSHDMGAAVGRPTEVMIDGPDTVAINLLQHTPGPDTRSGRMGLYMRDEFGYSASGLTPVVTSAHNVVGMDRAANFYTQVLGLKPILDVVMRGEDMSTFLALPEGAEGRTIIVEGHDRFGKVAMTEALNYEVVDLVPRADPPAIGYIAQAFDVADLDVSLAKAVELGAERFSGPVDLDLPGFGPVRTAIVRHPCSGALQQFIQS